MGAKPGGCQARVLRASTCVSIVVHTFCVLCRPAVNKLCSRIRLQCHRVDDFVTLLVTLSRTAVDRAWTHAKEAVRRLGQACAARNEAEATAARNIVINAMLGYRIIMLPSAREVPEGAPSEPVKCLGRDDAFWAASGSAGRWALERHYQPTQPTPFRHNCSRERMCARR